MTKEVVWLNYERHFAYLVARHAFFSIVSYTEAGHDVELEVENDDYELWEERATEYESD